MDEWKRSFAEKLGRVQFGWVKRFDQALDAAVVPVFDDLVEFLDSNGFTATIPLQEHGRRSFKFELAEDVYLLMIFRSTALGEFELSCESFVPGAAPSLKKRMERVPKLTEAWAHQEFQAALDTFIDLLGKVSAPAKAEEELATV